ncbi:MAG: carotenoid biosynthesis protein [Nitrospinae bacterium]|nr:carotenoid biosynthesis protein [Nitrospinota bacterium]
MNMSSFPSWSFVFTELCSYTLAFFCLRHAWRRERYMLLIMLSAIAYAFLLEYLAVTHNPPAYRYNQFVIKLPGPVPLGICLSWGTIFYSVIHIGKLLSIPLYLRPLLSALLATGIDFVLDPIAVALGFWTWEIPVQWFGIPWSNYAGWFIVIMSFSYTHLKGYQRFPPNCKGFWGDFLVAFLAIIPSFFFYLIAMQSYLWLAGSQWIPEELLVVVIFGVALILLFRYLPQFRRNHSIDGVILAVPLTLYTWSVVELFISGFYAKYPVLVIVLPSLALLGIIGFTWPYLDKLLPKITAAIRDEKKEQKA